MSECKIQRQRRKNFTPTMTQNNLIIKKFKTTATNKFIDNLDEYLFRVITNYKLISDSN